MDKNKIAIVLVLALLLRLIFCFSIPVWEAPDEEPHYNYILFLNENKAFPVAEHSMVSGHKDYQNWQPPAYYLVALIPFSLFAGFGELPAIYALRLLSVFLGVLGIYLVYRIAGKVFPEKEWLAVGSALFVALLPAHIAMTAVIGNDTFSYLVFSVLLYYLVKAVQEKPGTLTAVLVGVLLAAGILTKYTLFIGVPVAVLAFYFNGTKKGFLKKSLIAVGLAAAVVAPWFARNLAVYGDLTGAAIAAPAIASFGFWEAHFFVMNIFETFWGAFGITNQVRFPGTVYAFLYLVSFIAFAGLMKVFFGLREGKVFLEKIQGKAVMLCALSVAVLFAIELFYSLKHLSPQGRHFFPVIAPIAMLFVAGTRDVLKTCFLKKLNEYSFFVFLFLLDIWGLYLVTTVL